MRRLLLACGVLGSLAGASDIAVAQDCIQDQYGRVVCGQRVQPYYQQRPRYYEEPQYYQRRPYQGGPAYGGGYNDDDRRYQPPSGRWRTNNGCPPNYTVQDGLCKPYSGR